MNKMWFGNEKREETSKTKTPKTNIPKAKIQKGSLGIGRAFAGIRRALLGLMTVLLICGSLFGCGGAQEAAASSEMDFTFSDRDLDDSYDESSATKIALSDNGAEITGSGASADENVVTISDEGTYLLTGSVNEGQIVVDAADTAKLQIVLDGVTLHCTDSAALYIKEADKVFLTLAEGSANTLTDGQTHVATTDEESSIDGTIFSKTDLTINGSGSLTVKGNYKHGIVSKDDLIVTGGTLFITAEGQGLSGKDCVKIKEGVFQLNTQGDAIQSDNAEAENRGFVYISGGTFDITTQGDGIQAETVLRADGGNFTVTTGGGSAAGASSNPNDEAVPGKPSGGGPGGGSGGRTPSSGDSNSGGPSSGDPNSGDLGGGNRRGMDGAIAPTMAAIAERTTQPAIAEKVTQSAVMSDPAATSGANAASAADPANGADADTAVADDTQPAAVSMKGLKAGAELLVNGGTFVIDSQDDSLHSNGALTVSGGDLQIASGDDGMHADSKLVVSDGKITVSKSYEGIEGKSIDIDGGTIAVTASDDGLNAAGGNDQSSMSGRSGQNTFDETDSEIYIKITGGTLTVNASGDGIDSNGNLTVEGGTITVNGPSGSGNSTLDYNGTGVITGGVFMGTGSSGMAQGFSEDSTQCSLLYNLSEIAAAGSKVILSDGNGTEILSWTGAKQFGSVQISSPKLVQGATYTLSVGGTSSEVTLDSVATSNGKATGGPGGGRPGAGQPGANQSSLH